MQDNNWLKKYKSVLGSKRWKILREAYIIKYNNTCQMCGWVKEWWDKSRILQLHHLTYKNLGQEKDEDLQLLCNICHELADKKRAEESRLRSNNALYEAQFKGWARAVYGEDWEDYSDDIELDLMYERFDDWIEDKEMYGGY